MPEERNAQRRDSFETLRWRGGWARLRPWSGGTEVAHLAIAARIPPDPGVIERWFPRLRAAGFQGIVTSALSTVDALPFLERGFRVREQLHLLEHDMSGLTPPIRPTQRARRAEVPDVLAVDRDAFTDPWRMNATALRDTLTATPAHRMRVVRVDGSLVAYAITGRDRRSGSLQRLAVHPEHQGMGWGRNLVDDGLWWLRRFRVTRAYVNTQLGNARALDLYRRCGFRDLPSGLRVLERSL